MRLSIQAHKTLLTTIIKQNILLYNKLPHGFQYLIKILLFSGLFHGVIYFTKFTNLFPFIFSPSIRGVFGLKDELIRDEPRLDGSNSPWTSNIESMRTRGLFINFTFH